MDEFSANTSNPFYEYMDIEQSNNQAEDIEDEIRIYLKKRVKPDCEVL